METIQFTEKQRFTQWWLWLILGGIFAFMIYATISQLVFDVPLGNNPPTDTGIVIIIVLYSLFVLFFLRIELLLSVSAERISFRYRPFLRKSKDFAELENFEMIRNDFAMNQGIKMTKYGWAYTVKGGNMVRLFFKDGTNWNIGTCEPRELENVLNILLKRNAE